MLVERSIQLICIDLDDTIVDTEAGAVGRFEAATRSITRIRPDLPIGVIEGAVKEGLSTHPTEGRIANFLKNVGLTEAAEINEVRRAYFETMAEQDSHLFTDTVEILTALRRDFRLALVTNGPVQLQRGKIRRHALDQCFDWIVISEEIGFEKPDPAIFEYTLRLAGVQALHAAHVGDSLLTDVVGANRAGLFAIWLRSGLVRADPDNPETTPSATITHMRDLLS